MTTAPLLKDLEWLARQAGAILFAGYEQDHQIDFKGEIDLVTEIDHRSEAFIVDELNRRFPGHQVLAEESGGRDDGRNQWYIDPLDGTVNYAHGIPFFCVSIAYAVDGHLTLAAVYDPMRDELFTAERGKGAWLNGSLVQAGQQTELSRALLVTGFPYSHRETAEDNFDQFFRLSKLSQGVRRLGSAALDLCYVAAGRFEGYWELSLQPWDLAAGALIAREAGAMVTTVRGDLNLLQPPYSVLAATPGLHAKLLAALRSSA
jgi:myo-inositol-1(or 4)-monophosphatase